MRKQTLAEIKERIALLEQQAAELRAQEMEGVVARIREAIAVYGLTKLDIFGSRGGGARVGKRASKSLQRRKRGVGVIRFQDGSGNSWTGQGRRPAWYLAALAAGKTAEDLAV